MSRVPEGWREVFLKALSDGGVVRHAAEAAGVSKNTAYREREKDSAFAEAWDDAIDDAADVLEAEARRRAILGVEKVTYVRNGTDEKGRPTFVQQTVREYSDTLLIFLLKGMRPEKFRDGYDLKSALAAAAASLAGGGSGAEDDPGAKRPA